MYVLIYIMIIHCLDIYVSWHLEPMVTWLFVKNYSQADNKENIKGVDHWPMDLPVIRKFSPQRVNNVKGISMS